MTTSQMDKFHLNNSFNFPSLLSIKHNIFINTGSYAGGHCWLFETVLSSLLVNSCSQQKVWCAVLLMLAAVCRSLCSVWVVYSPCVLCLWGCVSHVFGDWERPVSSSWKWAAFKGSFVGSLFCTGSVCTFSSPDAEQSHSHRWNVDPVALLLALQ